MVDFSNWKDGVGYSLSGERVICEVYWELHKGEQWYRVHSGYEHAEEAIDE